MGHNRTFEIAFVGLVPGLHEFEYRIEDKFFADFGPQDFSNCDTKVKLRLDKHPGFMQLHFDIDGHVDSQCDRCGNPLTIKLWDEFKLIVKLVDTPDEMNSNEVDPDIYYIDRNESHMSVAEWIYEFINLSIPLQHICPENEKGESTCNQIVLAELNRFAANPDEVSDNNLWKGLDQFKGLSENEDMEDNEEDVSDEIAH